MSIDVVTSAGRRKGRILSIILSVLLVATLFAALPPAEAYAEGEAYVIDVADPTPGEDSTWGFEDSTITVKDLSKEVDAAKDAYHPLEIKGNSSANVVVFADRDSELATPLNITLSALTLSSTTATPLFSIGSNWKTNLILAGSNSIDDTYDDGVGLLIGTDSTVTIGGSGLLSANGNATGGKGLNVVGTLDIDGDVIVEANVISNNVTNTRGILVDEDAGNNGSDATIEIAGDVTLPVDEYEITDDFAAGLTIGDEAGLTIPVGKTLTIAESATLIVDDGDLNVEGEIVNNGTLTVTDGDVTIAAGGEITNESGGTLEVNGGSVAINGTITNEGALDVDGGSVTVAVGGEIANDGTLEVNGGSVVVNGAITNTGSGAVTITSLGEDGFINNGVITNGDGENPASFTIAEGKTVTNAASARFVNTTGSVVTITGTLDTAGEVTNYGELAIDETNGSITGTGKVYNYGEISNKDKVEANYEGKGDLSVTSGSDITEYSWAEVIAAEAPLALAGGDEVALKGNSSPSAAIVIQPANSGSATIVGKAGQAYENITIATASGDTSDVELTIEDLRLSAESADDIISYLNGGSAKNTLTFKGDNAIINNGAGKAIESANKPLTVEPADDDSTLYATSIGTSSSDNDENVNIGGGNVETINGHEDTDATILSTASAPKQLYRVDVTGAGSAIFPAGALVTAAVPADIDSSNDAYEYVSPVISDGGDAYLWLPVIADVEISATVPGDSGSDVAYPAITVDIAADGVKAFALVKDFSGAGIAIDPISPVTYDKTAKTPAVVVKDTDNGATLTKDVDYTVAYSNNTAVGTAKVVITGKGGYTGTKSASFTITKKDISVADYKVADKAYDGTDAATFVAKPSLAGVVSGDSVAITTQGVPTFASKEIGNGIKINFTAFVIGGDDAANYNLTNPQPADATANITGVKVTAAAIEGAPKSFSYKASGKDNTVQLTAVLTPDNATDKTVKWSSDKESIATVDANGLVTFKGAEGEVKITATSADGPSATVSIEAVKNVTNIRTPLAKVYVQKGKSLTVPVALDDSTDAKATINSKLTWKSSKASVARVDSKGKVTAKKAGTAKITVTAANGKSKTVTVVVASKATKLKKVTAKFPKSLKVGKAYQLKVKLTSAKATGVNVTFKSSKASVLKVDKAGKLLAVKKGKATITIKAGGKSYKKTVTVK
jgi:uncharacterized protein YjdB